jgi:hypothetical protein
MGPARCTQRSSKKPPSLQLPFPGVLTTSEIAEELLDGLPGEAGERILAGDRSMPAAGWLSMGTEIWGL